MIDPYPIASDRAATQRRIIAQWEPLSRPHCSNCRNCVVSGEPSAPEVSCAAKLAEHSRTLWQMIRERHPLGFRIAANCPGWNSMSDLVAPAHEETVTA